MSKRALRQRIEWHRVTWYSIVASFVTLLVIIAFVVSLRYLHAYISVQIQKAVRADLDRAHMPLEIHHPYRNDGTAASLRSN